MFRILIVGLVLAVVGCTKKVSEKVSRYQLGEPSVVQAAPKSGPYEVKWGDEQGNKLKAHTPIVCLVTKGEPLGFETKEDGTMFAIVGEQRIKPLHVPRGTTNALWHLHVKKQTQFGKECEKFWQTTGTIAAGAVGAAAVGGLLALDAWSEFHSDPDCHDYGKQHRSRHNRR